ncbi:Dolichyl-diphosphooligosaccharide--protein glycosyltransferase subunit DAD1 [Aix galericulata]|nr:Dolichyl-diphosphooligosaccharide--protein glycosyltransferase subunit DAD1 [Aix galericulata]
MSGAAGSGGAGSVGSVGSVVWRFVAEYGSSMPSCLKVLDAYLLYVLLTSALQFGYCLGISTFPFNTFLSSFISTIGSFILSSQCGPCAVSPGSQGVPLAVLVCGDRARGNGHKVEHRKFCTNTRKNFFMVRVTEHWDRLPREVVEPSSREVFKACLDAYLGSLL